jgi:hypothetical protein
MHTQPASTLQNSLWGSTPFGNELACMCGLLSEMGIQVQDVTWRSTKRDRSKIVGELIWWVEGAEKAVDIKGASVTKKGVGLNIVGKVTGIGGS